MTINVQKIRYNYQHTLLPEKKDYKSVAWKCVCRDVLIVCMCEIPMKDYEELTFENNSLSVGLVELFDIPLGSPAS